MNAITYTTLLEADSVRWTRIEYASGNWGYRDAHRYGQIDDLVARQNARKLAARPPFTNPWR